MRFPSKNQMRRYAQRKAFHQWKRETGVYSKQPSKEEDSNYKLRTSGSEATEGLVTFIIAILMLVIGVVFKITWLWVLVSILLTLALMVALPVLIVPVIVLGVLVVFSFILS